MARIKKNRFQRMGTTWSMIDNLWVTFKPMMVGRPCISSVLCEAVARKIGFDKMAKFDLICVELSKGGCEEMDIVPSRVQLSGDQNQ
jgi:hypothetical protein